MKKGLISVIIPVYQENDNYLIECLDSVCAQTYPKTEIIVVDDGMTDSNKAIVESYRSRNNSIRLIGGRNEGVSAARNKGLKEAQGEWIAFIDSDDWIEHDYLKTLQHYAVAKKADIVLCGYHRIYGTNKETIVKESGFMMDGVSFLKAVLNVQNGFGFVHMKLYRSSLFDSGVTFDTSLSLAEDALLNIQLSRYLENAFYLAEPLYNYRFNDASAVRKFRADFAERIYSAMTTVRDNLRDADMYNSREYFSFVAYHVLLIMINYCCHPENPEKGIACIRRVMSNPLFAECIHKADCTGLSVTRAVTLMTLKTKAYAMTYLIGQFRQRQFRKARK